MKTFVHLLIIFTTAFAWSQDTIRISKSEILSKVLEQNHEVQISEQDILSSQADFRQTNALFLPKIMVSHTGFITTNPLMAFGSKLNQESIRASDFDPAALNDPDQTQNVATKLEFQQPLINIDGIWMRKAAKSKLNATRLNQQRTLEFLHHEVNRAYMALMLAEKQIDVLDTNLSFAKANKKLAQDQFDQGLIQKADLLLFEVRLTEITNELQRSHSALKNASEYMGFLMNDPANALYLAQEELSPDVTAPAAIPGLSVNRSDLLAMNEVTKAYAHANKANNLNFLPNINAFGSYEMYDQNFLQGNANGYLVGIGLNWTLLDGAKRFSKAKKSKAEYEKAQTEYNQYKYKSELELNQAWRNFQNAANNLDLTRLADEHAQEVLKIRTNRFKEGLERSSDLLMAEALASNKKLEFFNAIYEYNLSISLLNFLSQNQGHETP
ncbi:MAG: TolC family protein [Flavobacteriaceae bacterium]|nr:TolC family protein [Flavobacteriaceae bacterium]